MENIKELLNHIPPSELTYSEWVAVGMAMKQEGLTAFDWDQWSAADPRYKNGECFRKWDTFRNENAGAPVTGGTIFELAKRFGYVPQGGYDPSDPGHALSWGDTIRKDDLKVVDAGWIEEREFHEPSDAEWDPAKDLSTYLETLFQSTECVGYVTDVYENDGRLSPKKGVYTRTAGELLEEIRRYKGDIGAVLGDYNPEAGAWIRFNPLNGEGVKNADVTDFRYALVESDTLPLEKQEAVMRAMELPIACMVYSGKKSVHAIVRIDAPDYAEYRKRVDYLYQVCEKNGLTVDTQNKNPSRLSRMPGIRRNGKKQFLIATNIGKASWDEWKAWIEAVNDNLPDPEDLSAVWDNMPELSDCLIDNVLRKGHKMLLVGPSKSGKSFALIELTIAIAEGAKWFGFQCAKGRVLYVNLELDRASCLHRFKDVYAALGISPDNLSNIDIWNLRGNSVPMDKLAPKLIRRAEKKEYSAIIIDPIYKVITGDENSADQMSAFCNQFDRICTSLHAAVIYCHHHSKGAQGGKKSMDRASGSGVFARDPDALLDMTELELNDDVLRLQEGKGVIRACTRVLDMYYPDWRNSVSRDDQLSPSQMHDFALNKCALDFNKSAVLINAIESEKAHVRSMHAIRIESTLREFPTFEPLNLWFDYPVHRIDDSDVLKDVDPDDGDPNKKRQQERQEQAKQQREDDLNAYVETLEELLTDGKKEISKKELAEYMGIPEKKIKDDFCGVMSKGRRYSRLSKELKEAGYVYQRGTISAK